LQTIASGALGPSSFQGGKKTAAAGVFFHFLIALSVASVYYAISRKLTALIDYPLFSSVIYGSAVHLVMSRIVLPLSAAPKREFSAKAFAIQLIIHVLCVGLPIALIVRHFST
jgi:cbb3-type cytochrome oxidase subunit 1